MGALFLASAASSSYALLILLLIRRGRGHGDVTVEKLARADRYAIAIELVVLALTLAILGGLARPIVAGGFGVVFWIGVVIVGIVLPLVFHSGAGRWAGGAERRALLSAACVLVGGFLLRFVVVMSPQWPRVPLWYL
jgi:protein NrfD